MLLTDCPMVGCPSQAARLGVSLMGCASLIIAPSLSAFCGPDELPKNSATITGLFFSTSRSLYKAIQDKVIILLKKITNVNAQKRQE